MQNRMSPCRFNDIKKVYTRIKLVIIIDRRGYEGMSIAFRPIDLLRISTYIITHLAYKDTVV